MSILSIILLVILVLIGGYITIRLYSTAAFRSYFEAKKQYDKPIKKEGGKSNAKL